MDTAIGVFSSRDHAETAIKELRQGGVPEESIVFLTRSEAEAKTVAKEFGAAVGGFVGGATGMTAGVVAATLLLPGVGTVFALGFGAAALLGLAGAGAGAGVGSVAAHNLSPVPTPDEKCPEDVVFFREVLKEGRSLIVVRTESATIATAACDVLDRLGISMESRTTPAKMETRTRQIDDVVIIEVSGRITLGEGNVKLREIVREFADQGNKRIVLHLGAAEYVDSSGLGELVKAHTTIRNKGGELKLIGLRDRLHNLLQMTRLASVFDIHKDEASAIESFSGKSPRAVA